MISKAKLKLIKSLALKKRRDENGLFVAEGAKTVFELLKRFECHSIFITDECVTQFGMPNKRIPTEIVSREELSKASLLTTPHNALAIFKKEARIAETQFGQILQTSLCLGLDNIQDPGNLGTIIRIADWFGIEHLFCSPHTADAYSPKTVQATMGALARIHIHTVSLDELLDKNKDIPVFGTLLDGQNIYTQSLSDHGLILMGNEGNGISETLKKYISHRLFIPSYPVGRNTSESLNVATATAIVCAEFRRRN